MTHGNTGRIDARRLFLGVFVGTLLVQAAWCLVVPPFRGLDEHDHSYKAAAVARGDWSPHHRTSDEGWGSFVAVPRDLVVAAGPECTSLPYTTDDNCTPGDNTANGLVEVASSAASYNPVFYFVIGTVARPFSGAHALYAMRATAALLCALLIAAAFSTTRLWARTRWPFVGLTMAATPILVYSTAVAAPNGLELSGALVAWSAVLGLGVTSDVRTRQRLIRLFVLGAVPLVLVRTLGPLWLGLIVLVGTSLLTSVQLRALIRDRLFRRAVLVVGLATVGGVAWTLSAGTNRPVDTAADFTDSPWPEIPGQWVLWFVQSVAAFPARDELAPLYLYAIAFVAWWVFAAVFWRTAGRRERLSALLVVVLSSAIPIAATVATYRELGTAWQGRYSYPLAMGFLLVCGYSLDRARTGSARTVTFVLWATVAVYAVLEAIAQLDVLSGQLRTSPQSGDPAWIVAPAWVILVMICAGAVVQGVTVARTPLGVVVATDTEYVDHTEPVDDRDATRN